MRLERLALASLILLGIAVGLYSTGVIRGQSKKRERKYYAPYEVKGEKDGWMVYGPQGPIAGASTYASALEIAQAANIAHRKAFDKDQEE